MTGNELVWEVGKSLGPEQDWTRKCGPWMGSSKADSFANVTKILSLVEIMPFDEGICGFTFDRTRRT